MKSYMFSTALLVILASTQLGAMASPIRWEVSDGGNGHWYEGIVVGTEGISWFDAQADAVVLGGYLACITSAEENEFVITSVADNPDLWHNPGLGPWLGGFQPEGSAEPNGEWQWVSGEPWNYTAWAPDEPNNSFRGGLAEEDYLHYMSLSGEWNDFPGDPSPPVGLPEHLVYGYIAEVVPEPGTTTLLLVLAACFGIGLLIRARRSRFKPAGWH